MPSGASYDVQILLPIHNEAESIEATIEELYRDLSPQVNLQFLLCEDGSKDNTKEILRGVATRRPAKLLLSESRKGYSRAVRDGMQENDAPYLLCLDSDGQCDPHDFPKFWEARKSAEIILGWRVNRADNWIRKTMSRTFYLVWKTLYGCKVQDPSCPYMLASREVIQDIGPRMGAMQQGFWWEFVARAHLLGYSIKELPVNHRERAAGETQVYKLRKLPGIGYRHFVALFTILSESKHAKAK